jgi:hypothetical protein
MPATVVTRPLHSHDRAPAALCVLVAGLTHVPLIGEHLEEAPYVGVLFIALAVASALLAGSLLVHDSPLVWALVALVMGAAVIAFVVSRTVGLPQMPDDVGNWWGEAMGVPAVTAEALAAAFAAAALLRPRHVAAGASAT